MYLLRKILGLLAGLAILSTHSIAQNTTTLLNQLGAQHSQVAQLIQGIVNGDTTSVSSLQQKLSKAQSLLNSAQTATHTLSLNSGNAQVQNAVQGLQMTLTKHQDDASRLLTLAQTELAKAKPNLPNVKQYAQQAQTLLTKAKSVHTQMKAKLKQV